MEPGVSIDNRTPAERVDDIPLILRALRAAVRDVLAAHKRAGNPVAVWRDECGVWVQAAAHGLLRPP